MSKEINSLLLCLILLHSCDSISQKSKIPVKDTTNRYINKLVESEVEIYLSGMDKLHPPLSPIRISVAYFQDYLHYIDDEGKLVFKSIHTSENPITVSITPYIASTPYTPLILLKDSVVFSLVPNLNRIYLISLDRFFRIASVDSIDYSSSYDFSSIYVKQNVFQPLQVVNSKIFLPIGSKNSKKKFVDKYAYLVIENATDKADLRFENPTEYKKGKRREDICYVFNFRSNLLVMFQSVDLINLLDGRTFKMLDEVNFNPYANYEEYNYEDGRDLGYNRHYEETNERNVSILPLDSNIVILKRIRKKSIRDKSEYEYIVLDQKFNIVSYERIHRDILPGCLFRYKNGFAVPDKNLKTVYYYEFN